jgi:hypothetical protein
MGYIFTDDAEVVSASATLLGVGAIFLLFDGIQGVFRGVLAGAGKQNVRAPACGSRCPRARVRTRSGYYCCVRVHRLGQLLASLGTTG